MTVSNEITKRFPSTGATPAEQTAQNALEGQGQLGVGVSMVDSEKQIYSIVEDAVGKVKDQFGENLKFNSETLTNVLYDNIYKLLGDKFKDDEFTKLVTDKMADASTSSSGSSQSPQ